jgi:hypothetical protein
MNFEARFRDFLLKTLEAITGPMHIIKTTVGEVRKTSAQ